MFKVFYANPDGKVQFDKEDLLKILDEIYEQGYEDGKKSKTYPTIWSPTTTTYPVL